jgi:hypothetical protein
LAQPTGYRVPTPAVLVHQPSLMIKCEGCLAVAPKGRRRTSSLVLLLLRETTGPVFFRQCSRKVTPVVSPVAMFRVVHRSSNVRQSITATICGSGPTFRRKR